MNNKWDINNILDQKGRVAIVTGSSSGIGYETARVLANKNATVIIAVRNKEKGKFAIDKIKAQNSNADLHLLELDLANLKSIESFAETFKNQFNRLDLLINNAGVMIPPYTKTEDGFELQMGTNHLGHFALTAKLIDLLNKTEGARIVNVSSGAHKIGNINFDDINWEQRKYKKWGSYGDSKIANLYFTFELQRRLTEAHSKVKVTASHPGWTATELQRYTGLFNFLNNFFAQNITMGALPTLRAAIEEPVNGGEFYGPKGFMEIRGYPVIVKPNSLSQDKDIAKRLWEVSEKMTGMAFTI